MIRAWLPSQDRWPTGVDAPTAGVVSAALVPAAGGLDVFLGPDSAPPRDDIGVGPLLLRDVVDRGAGGWLRLYRPARTMAFSRRDALSAGFAAAVDISTAHGFTPVLRAPGGRAAAYHPGALGLDLVVADADPRSGTTRRFVELADLLVEALATLGVPAQVGAVPYEYCPGRYSVNADGRIKLAGVAQRVVRGGWLVSAVVMVEEAAAVQRVIGPVYESLGMECDVSTVGAVCDVVAGISVEEVADAVLAAFDRRLRARRSDPPVELVERARSFAVDHPHLPRHVEESLRSGAVR